MVDITRIKNGYERNKDDVAADKKYRNMERGENITEEERENFRRKPYYLGVNQQSWNSQQS